MFPLEKKTVDTTTTTNIRPNSLICLSQELLLQPGIFIHGQLILFHRLLKLLRVFNLPLEPTQTQNAEQAAIAHQRVLSTSFTIPSHFRHVISGLVSWL